MKIKENNMLNKAIRISFFLCLFSILLIPAGYLFSISFSRQVSILLIEVILGFQSLLTTFLLYKKPEIVNKKLVITSFLFCLVCVVSLMANAGRFTPSELIVSVFYLFRFLIYAQIIVLGYFFSISQKRTLVKALIISGVMYSIIGMIQYFFYPDLRNIRYLGWDEHLYRLVGTFFDPNFTGGFLSATFFLVAYSYKRITSKAVWISVLSVIFIALILTYSRSTYLSFVAGMIVFALLKKKKKVVLFGALALMMALILVPKNFGGEGVNLLRTASISARIVEYKKTIGLIKKAPLFGHGFNTLRYVKQKEGLLENSDAFNSHSAAGVPNSLLFVLVTTGLFGLAAFFIIGKSFFTVAKSWNRDSLHGFITISIVLFTHSMFENTLFYPFILLFLCVYIASCIE